MTMKSICKKGCANCPYSSDEILQKLSKVNKLRRKFGKLGYLPEEAFEVCTAQHQQSVR